MAGFDGGADMAENRSILGLCTLALAILLGFSAPVQAEFWGCKDDRGKVLSTRTISSGPSHYVGTTTLRSNASRRYTHDFSAQSSRHRYTHRRNW